MRTYDANSLFYCVRLVGCCIDGKPLPAGADVAGVWGEWCANVWNTRVIKNWLQTGGLFLQDKESETVLLFWGHLSGWCRAACFTGIQLVLTAKENGHISAWGTAADSKSMGAREDQYLLNGAVTLCALPHHVALKNLLSLHSGQWQVLILLWLYRKTSMTHHK